MGIAIIFLLASAASLAVGWDYFLPQPMTFPETLDVASMRLLQKVYESTNNKNVLISPVGIFTLLSLYLFNVEGKVADEVTSFLGAANSTDLADSYRELSRQLSGLNPDILGFFNNVFIDSQDTLNYEFFLNLLSYKNNVKVIDFLNDISAARQINKWVSQQTKGNINNIVSNDDITFFTRLALYNAMYFKGHWGVPFNEQETKNNCFITDDFRLIQIPMMHLVRKFYYYEDAVTDSRTILLPFKELKLKMVVVLPNRPDGLPNVLNYITKTGLRYYIQRMNISDTDIVLDIPRFDMKSKHDLNTILPKVGISAIFNEKINGLLNYDLVAVEKIAQATFIKVSETGSTGGEGRGLHIGRRLYAMPLKGFDRFPPPIFFTVNRPFLFAILYGDLVLFTGTFSH